MNTSDKAIQIVFKDSWQRTNNIKAFNNHEEWNSSLQNGQLQPGINVHVNHVKHVAEIEQLDDLDKVDVILIWVDSKKPKTWRDDVYQIAIGVPYITRIFIFDEAQDDGNEVLAYVRNAFACPFSMDALKQAIIAGAKATEKERFLHLYRRQLTDLVAYYNQQDNTIISPLEDLLQRLNNIVFNTDGIQQFIDWSQATLLMFVKSNIANDQLQQQHKRSILLKTYDVSKINGDLMRPLEKDDLMLEVFKKDVPTAIPDTHAQGKLVETWTKQAGVEGIRSWIAIPMRLSEEPYGVIIFSHHQVDIYKTTDSIFLQRYARVTQDSIDNLFATRNRRVEQKVAVMLNQEANLHKLIQGVLQIIVEVLDSHRATYHHLKGSSDERKFWRVAQYEKGQMLNNELEWDVYTDISGIASSVINYQQECRIVPNAADEEDFRSSEHLSGVDISMLIVPVKIGERIVGVLSVDKAKPYSYSRCDKDLLDAIARQAAVVIERTSTLEIIQAWKDAYQALTASTKKIIEQKDLVSMFGLYPIK